MKILVYVHDKSRMHLKYRGLIKTIFSMQSDDFIIGQCSGEIEKKELVEFNPQVIIHDMHGVHDFPMTVNGCVSIPVFSFINDLEPFVSPEKISDDVKKYGSDAVMLGCNAGNIKTACRLYEACSSNKLRFRFFSNNRDGHISTKGYCGISSYDDRFSFYRHSKVSVCSTEHDELDAIYANGNPVLESDDFLLEKIIKGQTEALPLRITREEILASYTSYDVLAKMFDDFSLNGVSSKVMEEKAKIL